MTKTKKPEIMRDKKLFDRYNLKIARNKYGIRKYYINSFDVETTSLKNNFYLFGFLSWNNEYTPIFDKVQAIQKLNSIQNYGNRIYATNLGFDFNSIGEGTDLVNKCKVIMRGQQYISVEWSNNYRKISLMDSTNYGGLSVEQMGKILGLPKLRKPRCLGRHPKNKKELDELIQYNKRDCEVTKLFMELVQRVVNDLGGELKCTISATAMDIFRRSFLDYDVVRETNINSFVPWKKLIFKALYGGRTELFKRGILSKDTSTNKGLTKWFYGDFSSLYPSVMLNEYPNPCTCKYLKTVHPEDYSIFLAYEGVSVFTIQVPYSKYPLLPYRLKDKLIFPYGLLKDVSLSHVEVRRQLELYPETRILSMKDTVYYTETKKYFKRYVETLYSLRMKYKQSKDTYDMEQVIKMLLNSLWGKFSMKTVQNTEFFKGTNVQEACDKIAECERKGIECVMDWDNYEMFINSNSEYDGITQYPIWAVYTTAYARIKLHSEIIRLNPVYVDTDSVITDKEIPDSKLLGELKLEKTLSEKDTAIMIKPKLYFWKDEIKSKGVPIPKTQKEKIRLINKILKQEEIRYKKFVKVKEGLRRHIKVNSIIIQTKQLDLEDNKRIWTNKFNKTLLEDSEPIQITGE